MVGPGPDLIGTDIAGRFTIKGRLGQGAMGVVYRAVQLSTSREVALKVMDRRIERDGDAVTQFLREAKLAISFRHPSVVPLIEFGQDPDGRLFLVTELVHGKTLHAEISRCGSLPPERIIAIGVQLCAALAIAHEKAIVHRDLKLENVMLLATSGDHIKILDFGLARSPIAGTPRHPPPELTLDGAPPAPAHDMYAIGVMLGELATGHARWITPTLEALRANRPEEPSTLAGVPAALQSIVKSLLAPDPASRPTAVELGAALRGLGATPEPLEPES